MVTPSLTSAAARRVAPARPGLPHRHSEAGPPHGTQVSAPHAYVLPSLKETGLRSSLERAGTNGWAALRQLKTGHQKRLGIRSFSEREKETREKDWASEKGAPEGWKAR